MFVNDQNIGLNSLITFLSAGAQNTGEIKVDGKDFASCLARFLSENGNVSFVSPLPGSGEVSVMNKTGETSLPVIFNNLEQNASGQGYEITAELIIQGDDGETVSVPVRIIPAGNNEHDNPSFIILIADYRFNSETGKINIHTQNPEILKSGMLASPVIVSDDTELLSDMNTAEGEEIINGDEKIISAAECSLEIVR